MQAINRVRTLGSRIVNPLTWLPSEISGLLACAQHFSVDGRTVFSLYYAMTVRTIKSSPVAKQRLVKRASKAAKKVAVKRKAK
jgi:hypothetical protein